MKVIERFKKELYISNKTKEGFTREICLRWLKNCKKDSKAWTRSFTKSELSKMHADGYLAKSVKDNCAVTVTNNRRISDFEYSFLPPFNNSYAKWINDLNTLTRMFPDYSDLLPEIYFSVYNRNGLHVLSYPFAEKRKGVEDVISLLEKKGELKLTPAYYASSGAKYDLKYLTEDSLLVGKKRMSITAFNALLCKLGPMYLITDRIKYNYLLKEDWNKESFVTMYCANEYKEDSKILFAYISIEDGKRFTPCNIDMENGTFMFKEETIALPNWESNKQKILSFVKSVKQLSYFTVSFVFSDDGITIVKTNTSPGLPSVQISDELNDYLLKRLAQKKKNSDSNNNYLELYKARNAKKVIKPAGKKGIRPYMQQLWESAVEADREWGGTTMEQKQWAWDRGFLSFRIGQYGLTEENYKNYLSDYQYHWLNRINGVYQGWINDKLTFRYVMEPFKEYVPRYYFSIYKYNGEMIISKSLDCDDSIEESLDGVCTLLKREKKLAYKAAAGTHGDGFYVLEYSGELNSFVVNGEKVTEDELKNVITTQKSFYVITSFIYMHQAIKQIYPNSVNSIRMMLINRNGYDPKIMQTYIRIGSAKTGFTDNVGYGGICAMIDKKTGSLYDPETLNDHVYYPCPVHPDTGVEITGITVPGWDNICETVIRICRSMPELEYLGFDVAVTEDGFNIMEINIHQDLHKVALYSDEIMDFFWEKIRYKEQLFGLPYSV